MFCFMKKIENIQSLILDINGNIIFSNDVIFDAEKSPSNCVFDWSPFLESIYPYLLQKDHLEMVIFKKVKTIHDFLDGSYDYCFYLNEKKDQVIWIISDYSKYYSKLAIKQQTHHEQEIKKQASIFKKEGLPTFQFV